MPSLWSLEIVIPGSLKWLLEAVCANWGVGLSECLGRVHLLEPLGWADDE